MAARPRPANPSTGAPQTAAAAQANVRLLPTIATPSLSPSSSCPTDREGPLLHLTAAAAAVLPLATGEGLVRNREEEVGENSTVVLLISARCVCEFSVILPCLPLWLFLVCGLVAILVSFYFCSVAVGSWDPRSVGSFGPQDMGGQDDLQSSDTSHQIV